MEWQKYPKSRRSIRMWQPETLDNINCHTFPGMGDKTLKDILLHDPTLQFFFVPKVLIHPAHLNSFIVLCNGVESSFMAYACISKFGNHLARNAIMSWSLWVVCTLLVVAMAACQSCRPACHACCDALRLCQLLSNQPPFKSWALPPLGRSVPPHPRLQGLLRRWSRLQRDPCWGSARQRHGGGGGGCWSRAGRT